jgi:hypothetical protein
MAETTVREGERAIEHPDSLPARVALVEAAAARAPSFTSSTVGIQTRRGTES